ncbi:hypothetical protein DH2020_028672 [Rehmannia glutinosa]|uniref:Subtilisin-like protease fibronectin type-III domain-containing protein n=1 Tax=Rehmannia glutinosa TaxID=99300 RepID=A0ABR0VUF8_REHGL
MDTAVDDGVDILSLSLGGSSFNFYNDFIALGAFIAMEKGILVSCSAGNGGPFNFSLSNEAPRSSPLVLVLIEKNKSYGRLWETTKRSMASRLFTNRFSTNSSLWRPCAIAAFSSEDLTRRVVAFETRHFRPWRQHSRGRGCLGGKQHGHEFDIQRYLRYLNVCPSPPRWCSGIAKKRIPDWSPAAIKSAIMTTADVGFLSIIVSLTACIRYLPANVFATGSGHVNPSKANDPGLVYDILPTDYTPYLCGLNYERTDKSARFLRRRVNCSEESSILEGQLNYPSFAVTFGRFQPTTQTYNRTVTNVGDPSSSYAVEIAPPPGIDVIVEPSKLDLPR